MCLNSFCRFGVYRVDLYSFHANTAVKSMFSPVMFLKMTRNYCQLQWINMQR